MTRAFDAAPTTLWTTVYPPPAWRTAGRGDVTRGRTSRFALGAAAWRSVKGPPPLSRESGPGARDPPA
jgi:hypothetical protein